MTSYWSAIASIMYHFQVIWRWKDWRSLENNTFR